MKKQQLEPQPLLVISFVLEIRFQKGFPNVECVWRVDGPLQIHSPSLPFPSHPPTLPLPQFLAAVQMSQAIQILRSLRGNFLGQVKRLEDQSLLAARNCTKSLDILISSWEPSLLDDFAKFIQASACSTHAHCPSIQKLPYTLKRWSVFASPFAHRKAISQFERRTWRRMVEIWDMHPANVDKFIWYVKENAPADTFLTITRYHYADWREEEGRKCKEK